MLTYCTYCSKRKNKSEEPLPAIELYKSERINKIFILTKRKGFRFTILSGKYGVLDADQKIEYYNHLLIPSEVKEHSELIASQLKEKQITYVVFFIGSLKQDENIMPYISCMIRACNELGIPIRIEPYNN